jgi:hypothetical protein
LKNLLLRKFHEILGFYLSKWKGGSYAKVVKLSGNTGEAYSEMVHSFRQYVERAKIMNTNRCFEFLRERRLANIFKAWLNVKRYLKNKRIKMEESKEHLA